MTTTTDQHEQAAGPLVICGMHRSGTSLTASSFAGAGVNLGDRLLGADVDNQLGHFEDVDILLFHQALLRALGLNGDGYVTRPLPPIADEFTAKAEQIIAARTVAGRLWGWKEPRTVLFLDFWDRLLPDARYFFVFRNPWDVADSLFRRGDASFVVEPRLAIELWVHYNRQIVEFVSRHPTRCLIVEISRIIAEPDLVFEMVRSQLHLPIGSPPDTFRNDLFGRECNPHGAAIIRGLAPEAIAIYERLRELAGQPPYVTDEPAVEAASLAACAVEEWARASRAAVRERKLQAELSAASSREHTLSTELTTTTDDRDRISSQLVAVTADRDRISSQLVAVTADRDHISSQLVAMTADRDRLVEELEVAAAARLRLEAECLQLGASNERLASELAEARDASLVKHLARWISGCVARRRPNGPGPADESPAQRDADRRTAA